MALIFAAASVFAGRIATFTPSIDPNTTNTILVDTRNVTGLSLTASGTGTAYNLDTLTVSVNPTTNSGQKFSVFFNGTNYLYTWTNQAGLTTQVAANPATQITLGITNGDAGIAGNVLALILGAGTNQYVITNAPTGQQILATNNVGMLATNVFSFLQTNFPSFALSWLGTNRFTITTATNDNLSFSNSVIFTNLSATVFTATNTVATNMFFVQPGTTTGGSASNLLAVLDRDLLSVNAYMTATNVVTLQTYGLPIGVTNSATWASSSNTTNTPNGNIQITANVSDDVINWLPYSGLNLTLLISTNGSAVGTNVISLGGWPFVQLIVGNVATNGAFPSFKLVTSGL